MKIQYLALNKIQLSMKKILLFTIALGLAAGLSAQETNTDDGFLNAFTAEKTEWIIDYTTSVTHECEYIDKLILEGDTIIDKMNWKIIKAPPYQAAGFIRTDGQKVIFKPDEETKNNIYPYTGKEILLYDFSFDVGDSVLVFYNQEPWYAPIIGVDSVLLHDGKKHKRLITSSNGSFIEGLGSAKTSPLVIFTPIPTCENCVIRETNICCHVNGQLLYRNPRFSDCEGTIVGNETIKIPDNLKISMSDNMLHIIFEEEKFFDVAVYSMNGVLLKQRKGHSKEAVIPVYSGKGIFVVRVTCGNDVYSRKVYNL
ncbi:T9SS C-terminal target domain-containing protein [Parabacteroides sp. AF14-59]|nr:T9SS C-terminal target domain-containing protein [Parabacteroides sp. AF14-59]